MTAGGEFGRTQLQTDDRRNWTNRPHVWVHESIHDGARQASNPWTVAVSSLLVGNTHNMSATHQAYTCMSICVYIHVPLQVQLARVHVCGEYFVSYAYQRKDRSACSIITSSYESTSLEWTATAFMVGAKSWFSRSRRL